MHPRLPNLFAALLILMALGVVCSPAGAAAPIGASVVAATPSGTSNQTTAGARGKDLETYQRTPVGLTADGHPFRGNPDAPLTLVEYTDYLCPFCEAYFRQTLPALLDKYGRSGQVKFVVHDFPLASLHPGAPKGAAAAMCVAAQGAARFWQMHDALFESQQQWNRLPDPAVFLAATAKKVGVDIATYEQCMNSSDIDARLQKSLADAQSLGFSGTPTFEFMSQATGKTYTLVGARPIDVFERWIDTLLAGKEPPEAKPPEKPELPFWAKAEGLAPDPKRPGFTVAGDPYKGDANARLVLVEFEDFACPACQRHVLETQPVLDKRFVETGDVRWVVKHFPLRMHPHAPAAASAAECAGDQGQFWPMHRRLFEQMDAWSTETDPEAALVRLASGLKLNRAKFIACFKSRGPLERVLRDLFDGQAIGVKNLPTFILFSEGTGYVLVGARSPDQFANTLQQQLESAKSGVNAMGPSAHR